MICAGITACRLRAQAAFQTPETNKKPHAVLSCAVGKLLVVSRCSSRLCLHFNGTCLTPRKPFKRRITQIHLGIKHKSETCISTDVLLRGLAVQNEMWLSTMNERSPHQVVETLCPFEVWSTSKSAFQISAQQGWAAFCTDKSNIIILSIIILLEIGFCAWLDKFFWQTL